MGIRLRYTFDPLPQGVHVHSINQSGITSGSWLTDSIFNDSLNYKIIKYKVTPYTIDSSQNELCTGITDSFYVNALPTLKATLVADTFIGKINGKNLNISCYGYKNGNIKLNLAGGLLSMGQNPSSCIYNWSNGKHTQNISNLPKATYSVNVTDGNQCKTSGAITLNQPDKLSAKINSTQPDCSGTALGSLIAIASGGAPKYEYRWSFPNRDTVFNPAISSCTEGTYHLNVHDTNKCVYDTSLSLYGSQILADPNPSQYGSYNISCHNGNDGEFHPAINILSGIDYECIWINITNKLHDTLLVEKDSGTIYNLPKGIYELQIIPVSGKCGPTILTDTLWEPPMVNVLSDISSTYNGKYNLNCDNKNDGWIKLNVSGGQGNYKYIWTNPDTVIISHLNHSIDSINSVLINNLDSGTYHVNLQDTSFWERGTRDTVKSYCPILDTVFKLKKPPKLLITDTISNYNGWNISCYDSTNGYIKIKTVKGGIGAYKYLWQKNDDTLNKSDSSLTYIKGLSDGTYQLTVQYGNKCARTWNVPLTKPDSMSINPVFKNYFGYNISCFGKTDGTVDTLNIKGGAGLYDYTWYLANNPDSIINTTENPGNLGDKNYQLKVKDQNKCVEIFNIPSLFEPGKLSGIAEIKNPNCSSDKNGKIKVVPVGGDTIYPQYHFLWSTSTHDTLDSINNLGKGSYSVTITDKNNCTATVSAKIVPPDSLIVKLFTDTISFHGRDIRCYNESNATIYAKVDGGTMPYNYNWGKSEPSSDSVITGKPIGSYKVIVTDAERCKDSASIIVTQPDSLTIKISSKDVSCFDGSDGNATAIVNGGTRPYSYNWSDEQSDSAIIDLKTDTFNVDVYDINQCHVNSQIIIHQPDKLKVDNKSIKEPYCPASYDGEIHINVIGGITPYEPIWSNGNTGNDIVKLGEGDYILSLTDSNNCLLTDTTTLIALHSACIYIPKAFAPGGNIQNKTWNILVGDPNNHIDLNVLFPNAIIEVYNRWGEMVYKSDVGYKQEWNGTYNGKALPMDSYYYSIDLKDGSKKIIGIVSIIR